MIRKQSISRISYLNILKEILICCSTGRCQANFMTVKGPAVILYQGLLFGALESLLLAHATIILMIVAAAIVKAFGQGIAQPVLQAESFNRLDKSRRGVASSDVYIGASIGQCFGPLLGGGLAFSFEYEGMFNDSAALMLGGVVAFYIYNRYTATAKTKVLQEA